MALNENQIAKIQVDYEAGIVTLDDIAEKHTISKRTVIRLAKRLSWERGKSHQNVTNKIAAKAETKLIEDGSYDLYDSTKTYAKNVEVIEKGVKLVLASFFKEVKESKNNLSKSEADRLTAAQKLLEGCAKIYKLNMEGRRIALGLDGGGSKGNSADIDSLIKARMDKLKGVT